MALINYEELERLSQTKNVSILTISATLESEYFTILVTHLQRQYHSLCACDSVICWCVVQVTNEEVSKRKNIFIYSKRGNDKINTHTISLPPQLKVLNAGILRIYLSHHSDAWVPDTKGLSSIFGLVSYFEIGLKDAVVRRWKIIRVEFSMNRSKEQTPSAIHSRN